MMRVVEPLRARGALIVGRAAPDEARRHHRAAAHRRASPRTSTSRALEYELPVASAQVKSALLLSGLYAHGATHAARADALARSHRAHAARARRPAADGGPDGRARSRRDGTDRCRRSTSTLPGDVSAAAFLLVAARHRAGLARHRARRRDQPDAHRASSTSLRDMGVELGRRAAGRAGRRADREPARGGRSTLHRRRSVGGELVPRAIDEIPALCALAARARGVTDDPRRGRAARQGERPHRRDDRRAARVRRHVRRAPPTACAIEGGETPPARRRVVESRGDHRIAMTAAVLALAATGRSRIATSTASRRASRASWERCARSAPPSPFFNPLESPSGYRRTHGAPSAHVRLRSRKRPLSSDPVESLVPAVRTARAPVERAEVDAPPPSEPRPRETPQPRARSRAIRARADRRAVVGHRGGQRRRELFVVYQPIVHMKTGKPFAYEALVRSRAPAFPDPPSILSRGDRVAGDGASSGASFASSPRTIARTRRSS